MYKLLQINTVANTGSTGRIAEQLGQYAISQGWKSYIAYGREAKDSKSELIKIGSTLDVYTHAIGARLFDCQGLMSKNATRKFLKQIEKIQPDIIHLHNIHGYYINYPMLFNYLKRKNIPTIITMHDFWLMTGHCAYINESCNKWETGCGHCPRLSQYPATKLDCSARNWKRKAGIFADMPNVTLVPVSYWLAKYVDKSFLHEVKQQMIYNGIDTRAFKPYRGKSHTVDGIDWTKYTIMTIATRWTKANGFDDIIQLSRVLPDDFRIVMIGLDDRQLEDLPENIIGLKKIESLTSLRELYSKADVIFNVNREVTFGLVTVEAMACGTPAVVFHNTAGEELVNKQTGFVINSVYDLIEILPVIRNMDKEKTAISCRQRVLDMFDADKQSYKYFDLYLNILHKQK